MMNGLVLLLFLLSVGLQGAFSRSGRSLLLQGNDDGCAAPYEQCDGEGWSSPACCEAGSSCLGPVNGTTAGSPLRQCVPDPSVDKIRFDGRRELLPIRVCTPPAGSTFTEGQACCPSFPYSGFRWHNGVCQITDQRPEAGVGPVSMVSRAKNLLDAFVVGSDGGVYTSSWSPAADPWTSWKRIGSLEVTPLSLVSAVSRSTNLIDIFVTGLDGFVYTATFSPASGWKGWFRIGSNLKVAPHSAVTAVSRSSITLDVFVVGIDSVVYTAAWESGRDPTNDGPNAYRGWWSVDGAKVPPGSYVGVASKATDQMHIFVTAEDSRILSASYKPGDPGFVGWFPVAGGQATPGSPVTAVSRSFDKLDVFVIGLDGFAYTAAWEGGGRDRPNEFRGWWRIGSTANSFTKRTPITPLSRGPDLLDIFTVQDRNGVVTASWQPGKPAFSDWAEVAIQPGKMQTLPGTMVAAAARATNFMDIAVVSLDTFVRAAAWEPNRDAPGTFRGWWGVNSMATGVTDPQVSAWRNVGTALSAANTDWSEEAQGIDTDGSSWFLSSNNDGNIVESAKRSIRKISNSGAVQNTWIIPSDTHVGALGFYDGWLYIPIDDDGATSGGFWRVSADFSQRKWVPVKSDDYGFSWAGVNPLNGRLYGLGMKSTININQLLAFDRLTGARRPEDDIFLKAGSLVGAVGTQGAHFTPRGRLLVVESNTLSVFSSFTGYMFGRVELGDYGHGTGSTGSEVEAVTVRSWNFGGTFAPVHILELDNDFPSKDNCYIHSYSVPQPNLL